MIGRETRGGKPRDGPFVTRILLPRAERTLRAALGNGSSAHVRRVEQLLFQRRSARMPNSIQRALFEFRRAYHLQRETAARRVVAQAFQNAAGSAPRNAAARNDSRMALRPHRRYRSRLG